METLAIVAAAGGREDGDRISDLTQRARAGDRAAFESLVVAHERQVLRVALRLLGRPEDAQDAAPPRFCFHHSTGHARFIG